MLKTDWYVLGKQLVASTSLSALAFYGPNWLKGNPALVICPGIDAVTQCHGGSLLAWFLWMYQWCWVNTHIAVQVKILDRMEENGVSFSNVQVYKGFIIFIWLFIINMMVPTAQLRNFFCSYFILLFVPLRAGFPLKAVGFTIASPLTALALVGAVMLLPLPTLASDMLKIKVRQALKDLNDRQRALCDAFQPENCHSHGITKHLAIESRAATSQQEKVSSFLGFTIQSVFEPLLLDPTFGPKSKPAMGLIASVDELLVAVKFSLTQLASKPYGTYGFDERIADKLSRISRMTTLTLMLISNELKGGNEKLSIAHIVYGRGGFLEEPTLMMGELGLSKTSPEDLTGIIEQEIKEFWALQDELRSSLLKDNSDTVEQRGVFDKGGLDPLTTAAYFSLVSVLQQTNGLLTTLKGTPKRTWREAAKTGWKTLAFAATKIFDMVFYRFNDGQVKARLIIAIRYSVTITICALWPLVDGLTSGIGGTFTPATDWVPFIAAAVWLDDSSAMPQRVLERIVATVLGVVVAQAWAFYVPNYEWSLMIYIPVIVFLNHYFTDWKGHTYMSGSFRYGFLFALFGGIGDAQSEGLDVNTPEGRQVVENRCVDRVVLTVYAMFILLVMSISFLPSRASDRFYKKTPALLAAISGALSLLTTKVSSKEELNEEDTKAIGGFQKQIGDTLKAQSKDAKLASNDWELWYTPFEGVSAEKIVACGTDIARGLSMMNHSLSTQAIKAMEENSENLHTQIVRAMESARELIDHFTVVSETTLAGHVIDVDLAKVKTMNAEFSKFLSLAHAAGISTVYHSDGEPTQKETSYGAESFAAANRFVIAFHVVVNSLNQAVALLYDRYDLYESEGGNYEHLCNSCLSTEYKHSKLEMYM